MMFGSVFAHDVGVASSIPSWQRIPRGLSRRLMLMMEIFVIVSIGVAVAAFIVSRSSRMVVMRRRRQL